MTWLELIEELRKQPLYLLEREATVWVNYMSEDGTQLDFFMRKAHELTSPYQDGSFYEWLHEPMYTLSLCADIDDKVVRSIVKAYAGQTKE